MARITLTEDYPGELARRDPDELAKAITAKLKGPQAGDHETRESPTRSVNEIMLRLDSELRATMATMIGDITDLLGGPA